jgi:hypothetical protein
MTLVLGHAAWTQRAFPDAWGVALIYLPLACTAHLTYLARHTLFHRSTNES